MTFDTAHIDLLKPRDSRVSSFVDGMLAQKVLQAPSVILFGGERMECIDVVAILTVNGVDAGIATFSEHGEFSERAEKEPAIVAI